jgi:hypothetical protein
MPIQTTFTLNGTILPLSENRYAVVEHGSYVFSDRFASWSEALSFAEDLAKRFPGERYDVVFLDTKVIGIKPEVQVEVSMDF